MREKLFRPLALAGAAAMGALVAAPAAADSLDFSFQLVTPGATALSGASYVLTLSDGARGGQSLPANQVRLSLSNPGGVGSIREIYFDDADAPLLVSSPADPLSPLINDSDGPLLLEQKKNGPPKVVSGDQVNFVWGAGDPDDLPGGGNATPPFEVTAGFVADAVGNNGAGINSANEWLDFTFVLTAGNTYGSVRAALESGALRVGLHVGDSTGTPEEPQSGAWVTPGGGPGPSPVPVPLPATAATVLVLGGGWMLGRRRT